MSSKERLVQLTETMQEQQAAIVFLMAKQYLDLLESVADNAFCLALEQAYEASPDKDNTIPIEEFAAQLGVSLE